MHEAVRAPAGKVVAHAPATTVDDVPLRSSVPRARGPGLAPYAPLAGSGSQEDPSPMAMRGYRCWWTVDRWARARSDNRATPSRSRVFDAALVHDGAVIGFQIGSRKPVTVGRLRTGG